MNELSASAPPEPAAIFSRKFSDAYSAGMDASHPFPQLLNKSHNLLVRTRAKNASRARHRPGAASRLALIRMPRGEKGDG
jgi:hypothetical protein